jgi:hypothetical protein
VRESVAAAFRGSCSSLGQIAHMEQAFEIPPELLVGHWRAVQGPLTVDWTFHGNGTFSGRITQRGEVISDFTGTWVLEGTWLQSEYTSDTSGAIDLGCNDGDEFLEFTVDHFILQTRTGKRSYTRVP